MRENNANIPKQHPLFTHLGHKTEQLFEICWIMPKSTYVIWKAIKHAHRSGSVSFKKLYFPNSEQKLANYACLVV